MNAKRIIAACSVFASILLAAPSAHGAPEYLGKVLIKGTSEDLSGLSGNLEDGTPHNRFGAFGSAIDYTRIGNRYLLLPDRGPADGATSYRCRVHLMDISVVRGGTGWDVSAKLVSTTMLTDENGAAYVGKASDTESGRRLDPEGIRIADDGQFYVSDEYGPSILRFDPSGKRIGAPIVVPDRFRVSSPSGRPDLELRSNNRGRQPNRGMEGLAITPDGRFLVGIMQSPLLQDGALDSNGKRVGRNIRALRIDLRTGQTAEYVYQLSDASYGVSEILAVSDHEFLVIERDGKTGPNARCKHITLFDVAGATDVSKIDRLPSDALPEGVRPGAKSVFIDVLDSRYGLAADGIPEKIEGLAFGPDLPDGRRLLLVTTDNDFLPDVSTVIWAFALDPPNGR
jgi:hypothetical protein